MLFIQHRILVIQLITWIKVVVRVVQLQVARQQQASMLKQNEEKLQQTVVHNQLIIMMLAQPKRTRKCNSIRHKIILNTKQILLSI